jgi:hypothetical protein
MRAWNASETGNECSYSSRAARQGNEAHKVKGYSDRISVYLFRVSRAANTRANCWDGFLLEGYQSDGQITGEAKGWETNRDG